ncbi:MAG TPA: deoxyribose-phosphate aldolase [Actinomycetota bacterium]|nr:deoxyribose-phosphate aldolase [Actinomycetota bacterium]
MITRTELARMVDHTILKPETTTADIERHCQEAVELGVFSVCVSPSFLPIPADWLPGVAVATVCGFPSGKHKAGVKASEAARSVTDGADEVDMVIDIGNAITGDWKAVATDVRTVREAIPGALLKVIIESAALSDAQIVEVCRICADMGADFVKTSTGFHPAGGASVHAVELMRNTVGDALGVKASGGIRSWDAAVAMVDAGASRLGLSGTAAVLSGGAAEGDY